MVILIIRNYVRTKLIQPTGYVVKIVGPLCIAAAIIPCHSLAAATRSGPTNLLSTI